MVFAVMFYTMVRKKCHPFCTCCSCRNWMEQRRCSLSNCLATSWPQGEKPNFSDSSDRLLVFKLRRNLTATCDLLHLVPEVSACEFVLNDGGPHYRWDKVTVSAGSIESTTVLLRAIVPSWFLQKRFGAMQLEFYSLTCWQMSFEHFEFVDMLWHVGLMSGQLVPAGLRRWKLPCSGPRCAELEAKWMTNKHLTVSYSYSYDKAGCVWPHWS